MPKTSEKTKKAREQAQRRRRVRNARTSLCLFVLGILFCALAFFEGEPFWNTLREVLFGVFGVCGYVVGPITLALAVFISYNKSASKLELWSGVLFFFSVAGAIYIFGSAGSPGDTPGEVVENLYLSGTAHIGAGVSSLPFGWTLKTLCGSPAAEIMIVLAMAVLLMLLTGKTVADLVEAVKKPISRHMDESARDRQLLGEGFEEHPAPSKQPARKPRTPAERSIQPSRGGAQPKAGANKHAPNIDIPLGHQSRIDIPLGPEGERQTAPSGPAAEVAKEVFDRQDSFEDGVFASFKNSFSGDTSVSTLGQPEAVPEMADPKDKKPKSPRQENPAPEPPPDIDPTPGESRYRFPPIDFLDKGERDAAGDGAAELRANGEKLVKTLESFGVSTKILDICKGPTVTRYELQPQSGVRLNRITNLADDIALNLATAGVRIEAPIPNKAAVGIEVPNRKKSIVRLRSVIESDRFKNSRSSVTVALGKDISGECMTADLPKMPHLLITCTTGSGKSICLHSMIVSMIYKSSPEDLRFIFIDPKMVEFGRYNGIPHLLIPVVTDARKASGALAWAVGEMLKRYRSFAEYGVRDIDAFNKMVSDKLAHPEPPAADGEEPEEIPAKMSRIVVVIDELADLMMVAPNEVEDAICRLAQMARAAGLHLIIATQRPSVDVITGVIKANIASRIALSVSSQVDSRTIIDTGGAEKLLGYGDMLFSPVGLPKPVRIQGCYVSDDEIMRVVDFIKPSAEVEYSEEIKEEIDRLAAKEKQSGSGGSGASEEDGDDPLVDSAAEVVIEAGQASTSMLQRKLKLGYARAARIMDILEDRGIIGPQDGSKPRQVRLTMQQWREIQLRREDADMDS